MNKNLVNIVSDLLCILLEGDRPSVGVINGYCVGVDRELCMNHCYNTLLALQCCKDIHLIGYLTIKVEIDQSLFDAM